MTPLQTCPCFSLQGGGQALMNLPRKRANGLRAPFQASATWSEHLSHKSVTWSRQLKADEAHDMSDVISPVHARPT